MMPQAVYIIWTILLIVTVLLLPLIVSLLHRTWRAACNIERYFAEMKVAGLGIASHTEHVSALDATIEVAGGILETAGAIHTHAETIGTTLAGRAQKSSKS